MILSQLVLQWGASQNYPPLCVYVLYSLVQHSLWVCDNVTLIKHHQIGTCESQSGKERQKLYTPSTRWSKSMRAPSSCLKTKLLTDEMAMIKVVKEINKAEETRQRTGLGSPST